MQCIIDHKKIAHFLKIHSTFIIIIIIIDFTTNGTKTSIVSEVKNVKCLWLRVKL